MGEFAGVEELVLSRHPTGKVKLEPKLFSENDPSAAILVVSSRTPIRKQYELNSIVDLFRKYGVEIS